MSLNVTTMNNPNNKTMPIVDMTVLNFFGSSLLVIPSIILTKICHPSKPGNGSKLKIAKLTEINPQR